MHIDHYGGLSALQKHFPDARAIATPGGDVFYNQCHMMVAASTPESRANWIADFGRLKESTSGERELYDAMTGLYPDWASNQTWLMFGLG